jgi:hypothetical protein
MKSLSNYQKAKRNLKEVSEMAKSQCEGDKPRIRMIINDSAYFLSTEYNLSDYEKDLLSNYTCTLHPKN